MARILSKKIIVSGLAAALIFLPMAARAEMLPCAPRDEIVTILSQQFKEVPEAMAVTQDGVLLEIFVSDERNWTILLTTVTGMSCIAASGENWERQQRKSQPGL